MSDPISGRDHFESRLASVEKLLTTRVDTLEATLAAKSHDLEKRLEGMNEFRAALKDQTGTFVSREVLNSRYETLNHRIESLEASKNYNAGRSSLIGAMVASGFALVLSIASIAVRLI